MQTFNDLSDKFGLKKVYSEDLPELRSKTSREVLKHLGISVVKLPFVVRAARAQFQSRIDLLQPIDGIRGSLIRLKDLGYQIGILTSNSDENVRKFLNRNSLDFFDFVSSGASIFGKGRVIRSILRKQKVKGSEAVYVGDETRDIDAARAAGIRMISVSWGFNSRQILERQKPDHLIDHPLELPTLLRAPRLN